MDDDLTATVHSALTALNPARKAQFLLDTALSLIDAGRYGAEVEKYLDVYLKTPDLPKTQVAQALLARANARKAAGDELLTQAHQDFQAVLRLDPSNRQVAHQIRRRTQIHFAHDPPSHRAPLEVWSRIANYIPRYHLRSWLHLSSFHRSIALHHIFHSVDLYFGEDQPENVNRSLDIFDRVKSDRSFALLVKCLRVHWAYEEGELLDIMLRVFRTALPEFIALKEFEWIGYPELRQDMVQSILASHPRLVAFGCIGFHFDACGISAFHTLRKLTLRAEDDDGYADWSEITTVLNNNASTLTHLTLGAYLHRQHSWDSPFSSPTIHNLTHLDLVDTRMSHLVLSRIANAAGGVNGRLESLTLHGVMEEPGKAAVIFDSDEIVGMGGQHTLLPRLKSFRFLLVGQPQFVNNNNPNPSSQHPQEHYDPTILHLYQTITHFLRNRPNLRKLDLGGCPWEFLVPILPELKGLRVLGVRIGCSVRGCGSRSRVVVGGGGGEEEEGYTSEIDALVQSIPNQMTALRVEVGVSELPLHVYANQFQKFKSLSFLHLQLNNAELAYHVLPETPRSSTLASSSSMPLPQMQLLRHYGKMRGPGGPVYPHHHPLVPQLVNGSGLAVKRRNNLGASSSGTKNREGGVDESAHVTLINDQNHHHNNNNNHIDVDHDVPLPVVPLEPLDTLDSARHVALCVESLDFVGWNEELYVIVRGLGGGERVRGGESEEKGEVGNRGVRKVDVGASTMDMIDGGGGGGAKNSVLPISSQLLASTASSSSTPPLPSTSSSPLPSHIPTTNGISSPHLSTSTSTPITIPVRTTTMAQQQQQQTTMTMKTVELKELPSPRKLDCAKGVDLGNEDNVWLERRDVPIDYDMPVGE
ncbi:hypothetical protein AGABI1DRAFT_132904 [Agaricus bisporus var. burnettii JB137-S8]|uniref:Uncharacterized protein n=1 Tax=Agaricus bisporus var. burnettii (strain JB137-S8 / ATCC MYA-4627 / FGSC 10392) TaxID=597362 RepID=K5WW45_AGABU|nr:uncharacterized protein AGABI1DRAFT_132904 [Agaricus bisporus var. burnettii JB137-S8]EKM74787.1 hypothetical protein AGABI1DRAFT_132904 [Agaricus bisporus var. burnettii JB137-S8]